MQTAVAEIEQQDSELEKLSDARTRALRWLARREYAVDELRGRLQACGFSESVVSQTLMDLSQEKLLSNNRYVEMLLRSRCQRGYGPVRIYQDAARYGLEDLLEQAVAEQETDWQGLAESAHNKRYRGQKPDDYNSWCKQARFLQSRGFTTDQVRYVLGEVTRG